MTRILLLFILIAVVAMPMYPQVWVSTQGADAPINGIAVSELGSMYVGGMFDHVGNVTAGKVAGYDGRLWSALGGGLDGNVYATMFADGLLWVGGDFQHAGETRAPNFAQWDGSQWIAVDTMVNGPVYSMCVFNGDVYIGGAFSLPNGAQGIARWTGSGWEGLDGGTDNAVNAIVPWGNDLIVGGDFSTAGSIDAQHLARWTPDGWKAVGVTGGSGVFGNIFALNIFKGRLVVGGSFNSIDGIPLNNIAEWNGSAWRNMNSGVSGDVRALCTDARYLYVGGTFQRAGTVASPGIARWNDTSWLAMGTGIAGGAVNALAFYKNNLYVGGSFSAAGGITSSNLAIWSFNAAVSSITCTSVWDRDGDVTTISDQQPKNWDIRLYKGTIAPSNLLTSTTSSEFTFRVNQAGTYIVAEGDSSPGWTRVGKSLAWNDTITISLGMTALDTFYNTRSRIAVLSSLSDGWNLLSLPVAPISSIASDLYSGYSSGPFIYHPKTGYSITDTLHTGLAYWLKTDQHDQVLVGEPVDTVSVPVESGWNMVGGVSRAIPVSLISTLPPGILRTPFYRFKGGYAVVDSLQPGTGYWVRSSSAGVLKVGFASAFTESAPRVTAGLPTLIVTDAAGDQRAFEFTTSGGRTSATVTSPPSPPGSGMDVAVRFEGDAGYTSGVMSISMAAFPVSVRWEQEGSSTQAFLELDGKERRLASNEGVEVWHAGEYPFTTEKIGTAVPAGWALGMNFPNPFNPATTIPLTLPVDAQVTLTMYDMAGREIVSAGSVKELSAGAHDIVVTAPDWLASGTYLLRVQAFEPSARKLLFRGSRAVLLMK